MRKILVASVSSLALIGACAGPAYSEGMKNGYTLELEGRVLFGLPIEARDYDDEAGSGEDYGVGGQGSIRILHDLGNRMDVAFGVSAAFIQDHEQTVDYFPTGLAISRFGAGSGGSSDISSDVNFQTLDAELGHTVNTQPATELRLFGGLRALHFSDNTDVALIDAGTGVPSTTATRNLTDIEIDSRFFGVGPRAGLEISHTLGQSAFALSGGFAVAVLAGSMDVDTSASSMIVSTLAAIPVPDDFNPGSGGSSFEVVLNVEGDIGLDIAVSDSSSVTLGYQAEYFQNVRHRTDIFDSDSADYLSHGPFARWTSSF
ncbi:MAG: Lpg1974 family pore-forming outer membrane protein [Hyphomicrobiales bacterium]